jgi:hypothetical protein
MAAIESKRSVSLAQPRAHQKHSATSAQHSDPKHRSPKRPKKRERLPESLRPIITKRGKTTVRRYPRSRFHRFEEAKGKALDYVEFFTMGEYHSIDIAFEDKTAMHFVIEPTFTLETDYADWKTGDWHPIKRWPLIQSESNRVKA